MLFILMVVVVKSLWGRGPGLLASLLGGIGAWYFVIEPQFSFQPRSPTDTLNLAAYFAVGAGVSYLGELSSPSPASNTAKKRTARPRVFRQTAVLAGAATVLVGMVLLLQRDLAQDPECEVGGARLSGDQLGTISAIGDGQCRDWRTQIPSNG